jgi:glycosyltransferase involved in cell wall biosynthesis
MSSRNKLSIIIPCFNEEKTLEKCVERVMEVNFHDMQVEILIVDDFSSDSSYSISESLSNRFSNVRIFRHDRNYGKGAAIRTALDNVGGDVIAIQDADLEYDPLDLKRLIQPINDDKADVVFGSRYLTTERRRVLYFWHALANKFLTFLSNMVTDLNLTDMETGYKVFTREVIEDVNIEENRFGFEPEIVAKIAAKKVRVFEIGISYEGRTFDEGKKIGASDALHAIFCVMKYGVPNAPLPVHIFFYSFIGLLSAIVNVVAFMTLKSYFIDETLYAAPMAFVLAALTNYYLCIKTIFRYRRLWTTFFEFVVYCTFVTGVLVFDLLITQNLESQGNSSLLSKVLAIVLGFFLNYTLRRFFIFPKATNNKKVEGGEK